MHIGIDGSRLHVSSPSGVEKISSYLIPAFIAEAQKRNHTCTVYVRADTNVIPFAAQYRISKKNLWTHFGLGPTALRDGVDVLFVPSHVLPVIRPKNCAVFIHDVCFEHAGYAYPHTQRWYLRLASAEAVRNALVFTHSAYTKEALEKIYGTGRFPVQVIQPAPTTIKQAISASLKRRFGYPYLLVIGRVEIKKNISVLLRAFDQLITRNPDIPHHLVLIGADGYGAREIHEVRMRMKNAGRVQCTAYLPEEEKDDSIAHAFGIVHSSLCEGWSFVLSEARSAGKPFAASGIPACRGAGGKSGIYVNDPSDLDAWMEALYSLIYQPVQPDTHLARTWETVAQECITKLEKWYG